VTALTPLGAAWPIERVAEALGAPLPGEAAAKLRAWLDLLVAWNAKLDLTAARSNDELVDLMLADALVMSTRVDRGAAVVDVGAGAGAPGLALALARPDLRVTLVEPLAKRVSFLRTALAATDRVDVAVERARGDDLVRRGARFDVAISRATLAPAEWIVLGERLAEREVWVLLAREEAPDPPPRLARVETAAYTWPCTGAQRKCMIARTVAAPPLGAGGA
jgi:16S rRNA (guanine527-N7)-methyltransferase